jgi:DNA-binding response OmpR family regulator
MTLVAVTARTLIASADGEERRAIADATGDLDAIVTADGAEALEWFALEASQPGTLRLAVLSASLPGYPGLALAASARSNGLAMPVVVVHRRRDHIAAATLARLGALAVLAEPFEGGALRRALLRHHRTLARGTGRLPFEAAGRGTTATRPRLRVLA